MPSPDPEPPSSQPEFRSLGLPVALAQSLQRAGLREAFPIQASVIPSAVEGKDVLASAPTGSGKTLAFGLPMLARLSSGDLPRATRPGNPRGVVLCPTRELAEQVFENLAPHAAALGLRALVLVGGVKVRANLTSLARTVDIVVATPGRLNDLLKRRAISWSTAPSRSWTRRTTWRTWAFFPRCRQFSNALRRAVSGCSSPRPRRRGRGPG